MVKDYDSTVARIAGNILSGVASRRALTPEMVDECVRYARLIVAETKRTEPVKAPVVYHAIYCALHGANRRDAKMRLGRALTDFDCDCVRPGTN